MVGQYNSLFMLNVWLLPGIEDTVNVKIGNERTKERRKQ